MHVNIGDEMAKRRRAIGLTQEQFADKLCVSTQAVSNWERGRNLPDLENLHQISEILGMSFSALIGESDEPIFYEWQPKGVQFSEDRMFTRLKTIAEHDGLTETYKALYYAREAHKGQLRKEQKFSTAKVNYFVHPLEMACHLQSMHVGDDEILAVSLLHDVCEDCAVEPDDLPFSETVKHSVMVLTKTRDPELTKEEQNIRYYDGISHDRIAAIVKLIDRCNNVSTMAQAFSKTKLDEYIRETEMFVMPLFKVVKQSWPEYSDMTYLVKYQLVAVMESVKFMLLMAQQ